MNWLAGLTSACALLVAAASANTEKAIFVAPANPAIADARPGFDDLNLDSLSPQQHSLRLSLPTIFPTAENVHGRDFWYLLQGLSESQRYEVRVCWAAVQPTAFTVDTFDVTYVFDTPELISSLAEYSERKLRDTSEGGPVQGPRFGESQGSILFLRVQAAADFFTTNKTLMQSPPPVDVDLILDPYLANVFPQSLVPTGVYIVIITGAAWLISGAVWKLLFPGIKQHAD